MQRIDASDMSRVVFPLMGYAPGLYSTKCHDCGLQIDGVAKRSWQCLSCAIKALRMKLFEASLGDKLVKDGMEWAGTASGYKWICPLERADCAANCGSYGCGN